MKNMILLSLLLMAMLVGSGGIFQFLSHSQTAELEPSEPRVRQSGEPLVGTFYYPWWRGENEDYSGWDVDNHHPPKTWRSMYLPDMIPSDFDPTNELYSVIDPVTVKKQIGWMREAGIQFSIASWFGPDSDSDKALQKIIHSIMPDADNPYPDIKWAILYEDEGDSDPSVELLVKDLRYIKKHFASSPYYLQIDGKPVVFVYNTADSEGGPLNDLKRWSQAREQTEFYVIMRDDPFSESGPVRDFVDGWYAYKPGLRFDQVGNFSASVSPGYWSYHDKVPTLSRDPLDFENAVAKLSVAKVKFKLILTWNEWKEGTGIEPAQQIGHDDTNGFNPAKESFGKVYLDILARYFTGDNKSSLSDK